MKISHRLQLFLTLLLMCCAVPGQIHASEPDDVIARVGDEIITFNGLDVIINSTAMIGMPVPSPGTEARNTMRFTQLDRSISANLLYLDALRKGLDANPVFKHDVERFSESILASMYKEKFLVGDLPVTDEEIREYFEKNIKEGTPFTQEVHVSIEATIRKERFKQKVASLRARLREGVDVTIYKDRLDADGDTQRKSAVVVASVDGEDITWGKTKRMFTQAVSKTDPDARVEQLNKYIDTRIMVKKARAAGMEQDAPYVHRTGEFSKSQLINIRRAELSEETSPDDAGIRKYYEQNRERIIIPESRKVQMVVLKTRKEAAAVKEKIDSGELTIFEAAMEYSIDPNARMSLGEIGWVPKGTGFPELDKVTFALQPGEVSDPVESPAGWNLVKIQDIREGQFEDIEDRSTWKKTRRMLIHEQENHYLTGLRKDVFTVEVYGDVIKRLIQEELDAVKVKQDSSSATGSAAIGALTGAPVN